MNPKTSTQRRQFLAAAAALTITGCMPKRNADDGEVLVWGKRGLDKGRFQKPRAVAIDRQDRLFITDKTGIVQVLDRDGGFIRSWRLPNVKQGMPCGLSIGNDGNLLVADTHCFRILTYTVEGKLLEDQTIGGTNGLKPGEFGFVTDVLQDPDGNFFVSEYGDFDRIQMFDAGGGFLRQWGGHGIKSGEFLRPQSIGLDENRHLWVNDACNHRIQVFDVSNWKSGTPPIVRTIGKEGSAAGEFRYPYGFDFDRDGNILVCEFGNHRVQKLSREGKPLAQWGSVGREKGATEPALGSCC